MVEQGIENPRVGGSIPPPGTTNIKPNQELTMSKKAKLKKTNTLKSISQMEEKRKIQDMEEEIDDEY